MRSGNMRDRVIVEKRTDTRDNLGDPVPAWTSLATRWANVMPQNSTEVFRNRADVSATRHVVEMRYLPGARSTGRILWRKGEQTRLSARCTATGTSLTVDSATAFPVNNVYLALVDSEVVKVTAGMGTTTWTVTRAQDGTTGRIHGADSRIYLLTVLDIEGVQHDKRTSTYLLCTERESGYGV